MYCLAFFFFLSLQEINFFLLCYLLPGNNSEGYYKADFKKFMENGIQRQIGFGAKIFEIFTPGLHKVHEKCVL